MKTAIYALSALAIILGVTAAALWSRPTPVTPESDRNIRFGLYEGRELVGMVDKHGNTAYIVEDGRGNKLFNVPVRNCVLDVRFRNGQLRFRENNTGREGYIDRDGIVTFTRDGGLSPSKDVDKGRVILSPDNGGGQPASNLRVSSSAGNVQPERYGLTDRQLRQIVAGNPFFKEASKILSGKLGVDDAERRRVILNYCEHFRMAYTTKDIDFLRQLFSDNALIIVGNVVKTMPDVEDKYMSRQQVTYNIRTKKEYLERLSKAFATNKKIDVRFSDFKIMRHPTKDGIYGVTLRQGYKSDSYADDGWLFLLWDFRDKSMPRIHVRTWQPAKSISSDDDVIDIGYFNLE